MPWSNFMPPSLVVHAQNPSTKTSKGGRGSCEPKGERLSTDRPIVWCTYTPLYIYITIIAVWMLGRKLHSYSECSFPSHR
jgi:hypothetical protein